MATELDGPGLITSIAWHKAGGPAAVLDDVRIFLVNTTKSSYSANGNTDWIPITQFTKVYEGAGFEGAPPNEWIEITLDTPFYYNGVDNLAVAFHDQDSRSSTSVDEGFYNSSTTDLSLIHI